MQLHTLEITAFGPFAHTARVDFDELSDAGLFLLSGPTGAGKSSILDAICFALYGDVPGERGSAKRLRSDQAEADLAPRVVLEATLGGRRFKLDRSPSWVRAKRRGEGDTTVPPRVSMTEYADGEWLARTTRIDEAGHLVTSLVGLTLGQFCQVAMLPQGQFQAFLRARSETRQALLQRVFRTERFEHIEKWLREHRSELRRKGTEHEQAIADVVSRISETSELPVPQEWETQFDGPTQLLEWASAGDGDVGGAIVQAQRTLAAAQRRDRAAELRLAEEVDLDRRVLRLRAAQSKQAELAQESGEHQDRIRRLEQARRTAPLVPLLEAAQEAEAHEQAVTQAHASALTQLRALVPAHPGDEEGIVALTEQSVRQIATAHRLLPKQQRAREVEERLAELAARAGSLPARVAELAARIEELPDRVEAAHVRVEEAQRAGELVTALGVQAQELQARHAAWVRAESLAVDLTRAEDDKRVATDRLNEARTHLLDLRERRLAGMAAEIAASLASGDSCPVCGSLEHPSPARPAPAVPDGAAEKAAQRRVDDLEVELQARVDHVRGIGEMLAAARASAGAAPESLGELIASVHVRTAQARTAAADLSVALTAREGLRREQHALLAEHEAATAELHGHQSAHDALVAQRDEIVAEVEAFLAEVGAESLSLATLQAERIKTAAARVGAAQSDINAARTASTLAAERLGAALRAQGFADVKALRAKVIPADGIDRLAEQIDRFNTELAHAQAALMDAELFGLDDVDRPDLDKARLVREEARAELDEIAGQTRALTQRHTRLANLLAELKAALQVWEPVREAYAVADQVARFVDGRSPDNRLQMRLSAYVLAHRLGQVVDAANIRLAAMSDQRYALEHSGRKGAGDLRGGLSLVVRDAWSGESRDPVTLSGGETFVVSLALALGLADVITQEAGGADLGTLFVDEGFGSLDADTLDDVMDTLDALRDGGRTVGVVSHVAEMQTRIGTQLLVHKSRRGSSVSQRVG